MRRSSYWRVRTGGSDQRKSEDDEAVDRISGLPDSILLHILSFLPIDCAVRTSLMILPFRGLWRSLSNLSLNECDFHICYRCRLGAGDDGSAVFLNFVDHVLALHDRCEIDRFRIGLDFHASGSSDPESDAYNSVVVDRLDKCVRFALEKKVKALDVALVGCGSPLKALPASHYRMPSALLNNSSLVELCLDVCNLESLGQIQLKSLRKLSLWDVNLSDEVMRNIVLGSPSLKKVSLEDCHGLQVLKIHSHPSLEELNVCICHGLKEIDLARSGIKILAIIITYPLRKITCPNVVTLELDGLIKGVNIACGSSVNDMALYIRRDFKGVFQEHLEVKTLLEKVRKAAYFTLCNWSILVFSIWKLTNQPPPSFHWKSVTTTLNLAKWHLPGISYLLETCNFLETLTIYVYRRDRNDIQEKKWKRACNFDGSSYWNSVEGTFHCLQHHLKNVMIYARVTEPYVIELIEFLLGNALILEKMVISTKEETGVTRNGESYYFDDAENITSDMLVGFSKRVFSFPRASPSAVVHLYGYGSLEYGSTASLPF